MHTVSNSSVTTSKRFATRISRFFGVVMATLIAMATFVVAVPAAYAGGSTVTATNAYESVQVTADPSSTTTLDVSGQVNGSGWGTLTSPSVTFYAFPASNGPSQAMPDISTATGSCTPTSLVTSSTGTTPATVSPAGTWDVNGYGGTGFENCQITGLTENTRYQIWSIFSSNGATITGLNNTYASYGEPGVLPSAPTNVVATPGPASMTVSFSTSDLGSETHGTYDVALEQANSLSSSQVAYCYVSVTPSTNTGTQSCTMMGLTPQTLTHYDPTSTTWPGGYAVKVTLSTAVGYTSSSLVDVGGDVIAPAAAPNAPVILGVVPGGVSGNVYVAYPTQPGGDYVTSITCTATDTANPSDTVSTTTSITNMPFSTAPGDNGFSGSTPTCNFMPVSTQVPVYNMNTQMSSTATLPAAPLVPGETYVFTATATNAAGTSTSSAGFTQLDAAAPTAIASSSIVTTQAPASTGGLTITWPAATANGAPVTSYTVNASPVTQIGGPGATNCAPAQGSAPLSQIKYDTMGNRFGYNMTTATVNNVPTTTYNIVECSPTGTTITYPLSGLQTGPFTMGTPQTNGSGVTTIYTYDSILVNSMPTQAITEWTLTPPSSGSTGTVVQVGNSTYSGTNPSNSPFLGPVSGVAGSADGSKVYVETESFGISGLAYKVYQMSGGTANATAPVVFSGPVAPMGGTTSPVAGQLVMDGAGNLYFSDGLVNLQANSYSSANLMEFTAASLAAFTTTALTPDYSIPVAGQITGIAPLANNSVAIAEFGSSGSFLATQSMANGSTPTIVAGVGGPSGYGIAGTIQNVAAKSDGTLIYTTRVTSGGVSYPSFAFNPSVSIPGGTCTVSGANLQTTGNNTCNISGLSSSIYYTITITAHASLAVAEAPGPSNGITLPTFAPETLNLNSVASASATVYASNPNTPPGAVTGITATNGQAGVTVSWTPSTDQTKASATAYTASAYASATATTASGTCTATAPATTCVITGLASGTYTIKVIATNAYTATHASTIPSTTMTGTVAVVTPPPTPTAIAATATFDGATLSWSEAGTTATAYTITAIPATGSQVGTCTWDGTGTTTATCTGLSSSISYTFSVVASNSAGSSSADTLSLGITPYGAPGTPTAPTVTPGNGGVIVKGASATGSGLPNNLSQSLTYTATAVLHGDSTNTSQGTCSYTNPTIGCAITGLTNGLAYDVTVSATNSQGIAGSASPASTQTPAGAPSAPQSLTATPDSAGSLVHLSWNAPASTGGTTISGYTVTVSPADGTCTTPVVGQSAITSDCSGLVNGTQYTFSVTAQNGTGNGVQTSVASNAVVATPASLPGAPTAVKAVAGDTSAAITWTAPTTTGGTGIAITGYIANAYLKTGSTIGSTVISSCTATTASGCTITGLTDSTTNMPVSYVVEVAAINQAGTGPLSVASTAFSPVAPPASAPLAPVVTAAQNSTKSAVILTVTVPAAVTAGGKSWPVTGFSTPVSSPAGATCTGMPTTIPAAGHTFTLTCTGAPGVQYSFSLAATNTPKSGTTIPAGVKLGQGSSSSATSSLMIEGVANAPTNLSVVALNGNITASWTAPSNIGGVTSLTGYTVTASDPAGVSATQTCTTTTATMCTISGLATTTAYTVSVVANNSFGASASASATGLTPSLNFASLVPVTNNLQIAVGGNGAITRSVNGGTTWAATADSSPSLSNLNAIDCAGLNFCVAVGDNGTLLEWVFKTTPVTISSTTAPSVASGVVTVKATNSLIPGQDVWLPSSIGTPYVVVSATSTQFTFKNTTVPTGFTKGASLATYANGGQTWVPVAAPQGVTANLFGVKCYSATGCIVVGDSGTVLSLTADANNVITPTVVSASGVTSAIRGVWCYSATGCVFGGDSGTLGKIAIASTGVTASSIGVSSSVLASTANIYAVRCPGTTYCLAFGSNGLILADNKGSAAGVPTAAANWQVVSNSGNTSHDLHGVACPTANLCIIVGASGEVEYSTSTGTAIPGATWTVVPTKLAYSLNGVRCSSATSCTAVGTGHLVQITRPSSTSTTFTVKQTA